MIATLVAMLALQAQPAVMVARPVPVSPESVTIAQPTRKQQMLADGRALVMRAERLSSTYAPKPGQPTKADLDAAIDKAKADLDSLSEMGEMESLRLQMAMDRMSKMMSTLSNIMKKAGDTQATIIGNIK